MGYINNNKENTQDSQLFIDVTRSGKERPWKTKKVNNEIYADYLKMLEFKKAMNVSDCADVLKFKATETGHLKLYQTWFCKSKLCPMCAWRRSMKYANQLTQIVEETKKEEPNGKWIFLTLTTKNTTTGEELSKEISKMTSAFYKMMKYKKINQITYGSLRTTEVTVNEKTGTYNQHLHALLFVKSYYGNKNYYINQNEWSNYWKKALKVDYKPIVHVQAVKAKKGQKDLTGAILETAKYTVKSTDYLSHSKYKNSKIINDLETGLYKKRDISFGGLLKQIRKRLQLDDIEKGDLINTDDEKEKEELKAGEIVVKWNTHNKNYFYYK